MFMLVPDTMRLRSSCPRSIVTVWIAVLLCAAAVWLSPAAFAEPASAQVSSGGQTLEHRAQAESGQTNQPAASSPAANPSPTVPEKQEPLLIDRDPVAAPPGNTPENASQKPKKPSASPSTNENVLVRGKNGAYTLERNVDEVVLNATVIDKKNRLVNSLVESDFKVYEDGVPQKINSFQHADLPISLGLLIDNSGSMRPKREAVNRAAIDLVRASNPQDESFVVNFSDEAYIDQDFTSSIAQLEQGLSHIDSKGGTALYDAIVASADYMAKHATRAKQVLLVITDGEDNASSMTLEQTVRRVQQLHGPVIYCIGLLFHSDSGRGETRRAKRALELLSGDTGGLAFFPKNLGQVDGVAKEVAQDIRQQYMIGYQSTKPITQPGYRTIRVEAKAKGYDKLTVRTRSGYYPGNSRGVSAQGPGGNAGASGSSVE